MQGTGLASAGASALTTKRQVRSLKPMERCSDLSRAQPSCSGGEVHRAQVLSRLRRLIGGYLALG